MPEARIDYATIVTGNRSDNPGAIGLIVLDTEASRLIAISAANVVDDECRTADGGIPVGTTSAVVPDRHLRALRPAASLLTSVLINQDVEIADGTIAIGAERVFPTLNRSPGEAIGRPALVHLPGREPVHALVVSTNAKFAMRTPHSDTHAFYERALELFLAAGEERARRGDAGALVTTGDGEVIGIVVSARGSSTFAAPVAPLLRELRACVPLNQEIIKRHNGMALRHRAEAQGADESGDAEEEATAATVSRKAEQAGAAWNEAARSGSKAAMLRAAQLIDESCFA